MLFLKPTQPVFRSMIQLKPSAEAHARVHARTHARTLAKRHTVAVMHSSSCTFSEWMKCIRGDRKVHDNSQTLGHGAQLSVCVTHHRVSERLLSPPSRV